MKFSLKIFFSGSHAEGARDQAPPIRAAHQEHAEEGARGEEGGHDQQGEEEGTHDQVF